MADFLLVGLTEDCAYSAGMGPQRSHSLKWAVRLALCAGLGFFANAKVSADVFADFTAFDISAETASGNLAGINFTLVTNVARPRSIDNGGVVSGNTIGTSAAFSNASVFTPALSIGDDIGLGSTSEFTLTFAQPVFGLSLHIFQLQANRLTFMINGVPGSFVLVSSDGDLIASNGNTSIEGTSGSGDDASGSLFFSGPITQLSWTSQPGTFADSNSPNDGFLLQFSVVPEPAAYLLFVFGAVIILGCYRRGVTRAQRNV